MNTNKVPEVPEILQTKAFRKNVLAIIECNFAGFKDEIINTAVDNICALKQGAGEWITIGNRQPYCSQCKSIGNKTPYCPTCGAKMDNPYSTEDRK